MNAQVHFNILQGFEPATFQNASPYWNLHLYVRQKTLPLLVANTMREGGQVAVAKTTTVVTNNFTQRQCIQ